MRHIWVEISHCTTAVPGMHFFTNYVAQWGKTIFEGAFLIFTYLLTFSLDYFSIFVLHN